MASPKLLTSDEDETDESTDEEEETAEADADDEEAAETVETDGGETVETDDEDDDEPAVAVVDLPDDEDDDDGVGAVAEGTTMGISNRALLFAGAGLLAIVAIIKFARSRNSGQTSSPDRARAEAAKKVEQKQAEREQAQNGPQIQKSDSDPLAADGEAMDYVFGSGGAEHDGTAE